MSPDSITHDQVRELWDKADSATNHLDTLCCEIEDGDIGPAEAHAKLVKILDPLQIKKTSDETRLRKFVESIVDANGPYPSLNRHQIIVDAYAALNPVAGILRNSLPVAVEPAPPVPQRLADEISAAHLRATPAAHPPRFFRETSTGMTWEFRNGKMTTDGEDSIFKSPAEILECLDVIEVDEFGTPLVNPLA